ncbi:MAG TPA: hypothetical protein VLU43_14100 [Anaeromyxobacteraceae bacterium]|nr:hypothetical protein [Anaeromyxobacteraceae bacterium]
MSRALAGAALAVALACAPALHAPRPVSQLGTPAASDGRSAADLLAEARAEWSRRGDPEAVRRAEALFLAASETDPGGPAGVEGLYGAIQARIRRIERGGDAAARRALARSTVELGQLCEQRAPASAACAFGLALALGEQAREDHATATEGLKLMVDRLKRAAAADPALDHAGPERVLALVLVRAPAWPLGPGDPEASLDAARSAAARYPNHPPNQLALAEALLANGDEAAGHAAARRAAELARASAEPEAAEWATEAAALAARPSQGGT